MKAILEDILNDNNLLNINKVYHFFERTNDILIIKYDGIRDKNKYTIIIIGKESRFETINVENDDLQIGLRNVLVKYKNHVI
ncbi:hypothetical protein N4T20_18700 [Flavobacterium sp. TR2]|uniref:hypothetical protein n=1 Tax=Flavobacterium sp. TR2 TaxID=2977321 RepID=UPI0021B0C03B|nr:hypothetical protein [Flavobacterium sp. TR2]UWY27742.1 hypothetical protein N4T20_18700 [Flavobacterium sp. TR2]